MSAQTNARAVKVFSLREESEDPASFFLETKLTQNTLNPRTQKRVDATEVLLHMVFFQAIKGDIKIAVQGFCVITYGSFVNQESKEEYCLYKLTYAKHPAFQERRRLSIIPQDGIERRNPLKPKDECVYVVLAKDKHKRLYLKAVSHPTEVHQPTEGLLKNPSTWTLLN